MSTSNLRGNRLKILNKPVRLGLGKNHFSMKVVDSWNKLPDSVVMAESVEGFKNRLDKWMLGYRH